ncbi:MAG: helix-hairpin-helix domain-containing protein, partial [Bacteroidetes bacterium]|nr:helix-hairpin-helix domain-containing protein [Bacteroidota bacterium]
MRKLLSFLFLGFGAIHLSAQTDDEALKVQQVIEYLVETSEEDIDFTDLQIRLLDHLGSPISLNNGSFNDFRELEILNEAQILAILKHRQETGPFLSVYELQAVEGLTTDLIRILIPFVTSNENIDNEAITFQKLVGGGQFEWFTRYRTLLEDQKGYLINDTNAELGYLGDPYQLYTRLNYKFKTNLSVGLTAEKDPGEQLFKETQGNGFDYYSGHFYLANIGSLKSLAIGDYQMQAGQGLTMWSGLGFGKSADVLNISKRGRNISPYRGANENQFLRGVAGAIQLGQFEFTGFYSNKKIDGNAFADTSDNEVASFTAFQTSGFHRTTAELEDKDAVNETIFGGRAEWKSTNFKIGATAVETHFDPILSRNAQVYQVFDFAGDKLQNVGVDYSGLYKGVYFFGETSLSSLNNGLATVNGALLSLTHQLDGAIVYRNYSPEYISLYGNSFRESSRSQNEEGIYMALKYKPNQFWTVGAYMDQFRFKWLRFGSDLPGNGYEYLADVNYKPSRNIEWYARLKNQVRTSNSATTEQLRSLQNESTQSLRLQFRYKMAPFQFTTRAQFSRFSVEDSVEGSGVMMFQDIAYKPLEQPFSIIARYALFNINDFDAKIYAYENDVLYSFSIPFYQDRGQRFYILTRFKVARRVDVWLRYAITTYINEETVGSGLD